MELVTLASHNVSTLRQRANSAEFPLEQRIFTVIQELRNKEHELAMASRRPSGLAAPQLGISERIIIIQIPPEAKQMRKDAYDIIPLTVLINPSYEPIIEEGKTKDWEACFSVSDFMGEVYRYTAIHYSAYSEQGEKIVGVARGFFARLLQHEIGHLNGELYIDLFTEDCRHGDMKSMLEIRRAEFGLI